ncbi:DUF6087 family protein [Streptomyces sp. NPDC002054]|uniref:DUF6087 family protein n=1 Tax=Streptomyces sp. NPDC002054 TaxID=3154663 RepID=UPI003321CC42
MTTLGRHRRPGTPSESQSLPESDPTDPLAAFEERRRPPMGISRRHRPVNGGAAHLRPDEARLLQQWDGYTYALVGTAANLAAARAWERTPLRNAS